MKKRAKILILLPILLIGFLTAIIKPMDTSAAESDNIQFVTKEELYNNFNLNTGKMATVKFGADERTWFIAGSGEKNTITLIATDSFATDIYGKTSYYAESTIKGLLEEYVSDTTYFSTGEKAFMKTVKVTTEDSEGNLHETTGILYLADAKDARAGKGNDTICVGTSNELEISLSNLNKDNGFKSICFWLRSPRDDENSYALLAFPKGKVGSMLVGDAFGVLPVFHLDTKKIIFASGVDAVDSDMAVISPAMTLRYDAQNTLGSIALSDDKKSVIVKNVPDSTYLVVQSIDGAYTCKLSENKDAVTINADTVAINGQKLTSFDACKVWLEATDADRITTAKLATLKSEQCAHAVIVEILDELKKAVGMTYYNHS